MFKLSIIIPVYNVEKYVEKCLRSCAEQDLSPDEYEIIVVNDGTKDNSLEIVERVAKDYSNITIISQKNAGLSAARNKGLSIAKGEYVWFVDSDDWIKKKCLKKIINKCIDDELDILAICAASVVDDLEKRVFSYNINGIYNGNKVISDLYFQVSVPCSIYNRKYLINNNLDFYEGIFHEDSEFTPRSYYYAKRISFVDEIFYYIFHNTNSITRTINPKKAFDCIDVAISLSQFSRNVSNECKDRFNYLISENINSGLNNISSMSDDKQKELNVYIYKNRFLFMHLIKSKVIKYKIEGCLFYLFTRKTVLIYKTLQYFNKSSL
ncbi:MAG: glycosyltransferase [Bacteroidales bacterium]|nr:glycosyltransferase [Bacteroidales bacterium]